MRILERVLIRRFAVRTLLILFLFSWLALSIDITRELGTSRGWVSGKDLVRSLARHLRSLEIAIAIAAPLALILVIAEMKRTGVLVVAFAAGLAPKQLRRLLLLLALCTMLASLALQEAASLTYSRKARDETGELFNVGGTRVWCRRSAVDPAALDRIILFRDDDLDVSWSPAARWSSEEGAFLLQPVTALAGAPVHLEKFTPEGSIVRPLVPRSLLTGSATLHGILAALNRVGVGALLLLLAGYTTLLAPASRPWTPFLIFLFLVPAVGLGTVSTILVLWRDSASGLAMEAAWLALSIGAVVALDRRFRRQGLRI